MVSQFEKWKHVYICVPCTRKWEKIDDILKNGQYLDEIKLAHVLSQFGDSELDEIKGSEYVHIKKKRGRKRRVDKNNEQANIKAAKRRKKRV